MTDIRQQISLDHLQKRGGNREAGAAEPPPSRPPFLDDALRVVDYLDRNGYLVVVTRDLKGNHELRLTDEGFRRLR